MVHGKVGFMHTTVRLQGSRAQRAARVLGSLQRCGACSVPPSSPHFTPAPGLGRPASLPLLGILLFPLGDPGGMTSPPPPPVFGSKLKGEACILRDLQRDSGAAGLRRAVGAQCPGLQFQFSPSLESGSELGIQVLPAGGRRQGGLARAEEVGLF